MTMLAEKLLSRRMFRGDEKAASLVAEKLCHLYESHTAAITVRDAEELGLKVAGASGEVEDVL